MSMSGRERTRQRLLRRTGLGGAALAVLALLFLLSGHWILGVLFAVPAAVAIWAFLQARKVR
jgi:hypothetical protein